MVKRYILFTLAALLAIVVILYAGDYVMIRVKTRRGTAFGSVLVHKFYAVPQKNGKIEFLSSEPEEQSCSHSLFPQMGNLPCWYLYRHTEQRIDL
jgi:hypothetical protein